jgi:hypothetical protein
MDESAYPAHGAGKGDSSGLWVILGRNSHFLSNLRILTMKRPKSLPSLRELERVFEYRPDTGRIYRKPANRKGRMKRATYRQDKKARKLLISYGDSNLSAARVAWMMITKQDPCPHVVRHLDGNAGNNQAGNLAIERLITVDHYLRARARLS